MFALLQRAVHIWPYCDGPVVTLVVTLLSIDSNITGTPPQGHELTNTSRTPPHPLTERLTAAKASTTYLTTIFPLPNLLSNPIHQLHHQLITIVFHPTSINAHHPPHSLTLSLATTHKPSSWAKSADLRVSSRPWSLPSAPSASS